MNPSVNINMSGQTVYNRLISSFPISLPTSLALESIFEPVLDRYDTERKIPQRVDLEKYREIWINVFTLFRNLSGSFDKIAFLETSEHVLATVLQQEIEVIDSLFLNEGRDICKPIYYYMSYDDLYSLKISKKALLRTDNTAGQKAFKKKYIDTMQILLKNISYRRYNSNMTTTHKVNALIMTHLPFDLLSYKNFSRLDLLESNTGKLKSKNEWNTKYYAVGDRDLSFMPFNKKLLFIFGDRVQLKPYDIRLRRLILDVATEKKWVPTTTMDKIMLDLSVSIKEPYVLEYIKTV